MEAASRSFTFATRLLPADVRPSTYALYAMFRTLDDLVDERDAAKMSIAEAQRRLDRWREWFAGGLVAEREGEIVPAVRETMLRHKVPPAVFVDLIEALEADLGRRHYETTPQLIRYCYGVAATVGVAMCHVLGATDDQTCARAAEMGVAMQLTNILRDVGEDLALGRVYLPADLLSQHSLCKADLHRGEVTPSYQALCAQVARTAEGYYQSGFTGIRLLPRRVRFGIAAAALLYRDILTQLRHNGWDSLSRRASTSKPRKLALVTRAFVARPTGRTGMVPPGLPRGEDLLGLSAVAGPSN